MARLTRAVQKIFGSTAGASDIAQIGSLRNGEIVYTTDPVTLQGLSLYLTGLKGIVSSDKHIPALEDINGIYFLFSRQLAYLMQEGIAEWDASTEYHIGSKVKAPGTGNVYTSLTNNNTGNEVTDAGHWTDAIITDIISEKTPGAGVTIDDLNIKDNGINGSTIIKNDLQLTGSTVDGFPNQETLYIWNFDSNSSESQVDIIGSKALSVAAGALTAGEDVLGNSKYCAFDGSTYLSSSDAAFNFTGSFSFSIWVYLADWSVSSTQVFISRYLSSNGWRLRLSTGVLEWIENTTTILSTNVSGLSAGWHKLSIRRTSGGSVLLGLDGTLVATGNAGTITAAGALEIGSAGGGGNKTTGRIDELAIHKDTVWSADEARNIYARSAKKFAVKAQDGTVSVSNDKDLTTISSTTTDFTVAGWIAINDTKWTCQKSGMYEFSTSCQGVVRNNANTGVSGTWNIFIRVGGVDILPNSNNHWMLKPTNATCYIRLNCKGYRYCTSGTTYVVRVGGSCGNWTDPDTAGVDGSSSPHYLWIREV